MSDKNKFESLVKMQRFILPKHRITHTNVIVTAHDAMVIAKQADSLLAEKDNRIAELEKKIAESNGETSSLASTCKAKPVYGD